MVRHFLVPGLLGPLAQVADAAGIPRARSIEQLLARADRAPGRQGLTGQACDLFGLPARDGTDLPTAALLYAHEANQRPRGWVLHADPVHLRPDQDRLLLFDAARLAVTPGEAAEFVAAFNEHFAADGLRLTAPNAERWYLLADADPAVSTIPLHEAAGRDVNHLLPVGARKRFWTGLLNEVQMLFHQVQANHAREVAGRPAVNGLWLSGAGRMPELGATHLRPVEPATGLVDALFAASPGHGSEPLQVRLRALRALMDGDHAEWCAAVSAFDRELESVLAAADELVLYPCNGARYRWRRSHAWRRWRRVQPLATAVTAPQPYRNRVAQTL